MKDLMVLKCENLSIGYPSKKMQNPIASDIDLSLKEGKLIALIGANGIGKSTLLRTIAGIQKPISGNVWLNGKPISEYSTREAAQNLSVVLTEKLPPSNLTVFELVALGRQPYTNWVGKLTPGDIAKVNQAMESTQISHLAAKKHFEISDGQLQKVLIARAITQDTPLIVLDEPTTHLDLLHKVTLFKLLKKLASEMQKCIIFSTHDLDLAIELGDEIIVMTGKNVVQNIPSRLIADGIFDQLFEDKNIFFDRERQKFVFKNLNL